jgi:predicted exporter/lauroyl/myristoyl acyltransferase
MSQRGLQHPGRWLWLLLLVPVALGFFRLHFDADVLNLLPQDLPAVRGLRIHQDHFANARELILTIRAPDAQLAEAVSQAIAKRLRAETNQVKSAIWQAPWLENPAQAAEIIAYYWLNQPPANVEELVQRLGPEHLVATLAAAREQLATSMSPADIARLSYDPYGFTSLPDVGDSTPPFLQGGDAFSSEDGRFRIQFVKSASELATYRDCEAWLLSIKQLIRSAAASVPGAEEVSIHYTGRPAFVAEIAAGMQHDMKLSVGGTAVVIAILFWIAHRRLKPMLWLVTLLSVILLGTLGLGGLFFGSINIVSVGFAAILLGLAVDYGVVHYQEALAQPQMSVPQIRRAIAPSILWAATTTIAAFLVLNWGGLPGLAQLGNLVAIGVLLAACVMVYEFLPVLFPDRNKPGAESHLSPAPSTASKAAQRAGSVAAVLVGTALIALTIAMASLGLPRIDPTANALRPRKSEAYATLAEVQAHLGQDRDPWWLVFSGRSEAEVGELMRRSERALLEARTNGLIDSFTLPVQLWPRPEFQQRNQALLGQLIKTRDSLRGTALTNGFSEAALGLMERVLDTWNAALHQPGVFWPENPVSQWILGNFAARSAEGFFALALVTPRPTGATQRELATLVAALPEAGVSLSGWELLGEEIFGRVKGNFPRVVVPMVCLAVVCLGLAFGRLPEVALSLGVLTASGLSLLGIMRLAGWSWNLLNLMSVPLILGTGIDYSIFMQLALRRFRGDVEMAQQSVGRALLLCGGTAVAGFGALGLSSNAGMASLGQVCAAGIAANMLIAIYLLPSLWTRFAKPSANPAAQGEGLPLGADTVPTPSAFYRSELWLLGVKLVKVLPFRVCEYITRFLVRGYWFAARHRCEVVTQNLLPIFNGDYFAARGAARKLFRNFAIKLIDLWRYEGGTSVQHLLGRYTGWENMVEAQSKGRGVLVVTPHLGNWEFGGPWLTQRGIDLHVITLEEPGEAFTSFRKEARARWQVKTLVIGNDPFAFVQIIRLLESGATVAMLIDRPSPAGSIPVTFMGRCFPASLAAAELARASGCALLPVYVVREGSRYAAHILPQIEYDRAVLRDRSARQALTQRMMDAFAPAIRENPDQWYNFVPVWADSTEPAPQPKPRTGQTAPPRGSSPA